MPTASYYRNEAARCRRLAAADPHPETAAHWLRLADEYDQLATALEPSELGAARSAVPPIPPAPCFEDPVEN